MISNKDYHKERSKISSYIPKPGKYSFGFYDSGNPEKMGLHQKQRGSNKQKVKKKKR